MGNSQDFRFLTFNGYVSQNLRVATPAEASYFPAYLIAFASPAQVDFVSEVG